MKANIKQLKVTRIPSKGVAEVSVIIPLRESESFENKAEDISKGNYTIEVKKPRKSKNMNSYMWVLCDKLAEKMPPLTKEDIYKACVQQAGKWIDTKVEAIDVPAMELSWNQNGIGWFCEKLHEGTYEAVMRCYIGSSVYDHNELRKLTNYVVDECRQYGIEVMTPSELDHLEYLWEVN